MNPIYVLQKLKSNKRFSTEELCKMLNEVEMFNIRNNYMEHVVEKCEQLIIDRIAKGPFEKED